MRIKVLTVFGTRPEAIKLFPVIHALEADPRFERRVCVTGQHREMVDEVLVSAGISPHHDLAAMQHGQPLDVLLARVMTAFLPVLDAEEPDWVMVQGDTTSALAAALAAHHHRVKLCHVEAGLRSGDLHSPWPEEANRRVIAVLADLHCAPTMRAAAALRTEGVASGSIAITGNTGIDALRIARETGGAGRAAAALAAIPPDRPIVLVTLHRRESHGAILDGMASAIETIARQRDVEVVVPLHPNPAVRTRLSSRLQDVAAVHLIDPVPYFDFVALLNRATLVLTDSGGIQEEAPYLGTPVLVLRERTERHEGVEAGFATLAGTDPDAIVAAANRVLDSPKASGVAASALQPYGDGFAAGRVCENLAAFTIAARLGQKFGDDCALP